MYNNPSAKEIKAMIANGQKPMMFYHIPKEEIVSKDLRHLDKLMKTVQEVGKGAKNSLILTVNGYDDTTDELYEIKEVRDYVEAMFNKYPHILYYISDFQEADVWILSSYADEVRSAHAGRRYTGWELFLLENHEIPKVVTNLTFTNHKFTRVLKAIVNHGKRNKDARGGKKVAIEYAYRFDKSERALSDIGITPEEVQDIMGGDK